MCDCNTFGMAAAATAAAILHGNRFREKRETYPKMRKMCGQMDRIQNETQAKKTEERKRAREGDIENGNTLSLSTFTYCVYTINFNYFTIFCDDCVMAEERWQKLGKGFVR